MTLLTDLLRLLKVDLARLAIWENMDWQYDANQATDSSIYSSLEISTPDVTKLPSPSNQRGPNCLNANIVKSTITHKLKPKSKPKQKVQILPLSDIVSYLAFVLKNILKN